MARILAVETSGDACSIALCEGNSISYRADVFIENSHSQMLGHLIKSTLDYTGISAEELDAVAVGTGPGSYTGIRIGMATMKGFAMPSTLPIFGVGTLENIAFQAAQKYPDAPQFIAAIVARKQEVFVGVFDAELKIVNPPALFNLEEFGQNNWFSSKANCLAGSGAKLIEAHLGLKAGTFLAEPILPNAETVGRIAHRQFQNGIRPGVWDLEAQYLKEVYFTPSKK